MMLKTIFGMLVGGALGFAAYWFHWLHYRRLPADGKPVARRDV